MKNGRECAGEREKREQVAKTERQAQSRAGIKAKRGGCSWRRVKAGGVGEGVQGMVRAEGAAEKEVKLGWG